MSGFVYPPYPMVLPRARFRDRRQLAASGQDSRIGIVTVADRSLRVRRNVDWRGPIRIISSLGPTRDGTLFYNLLPLASNIYVASFDAASGRLSSPLSQPIQQFKGRNASPEWSQDGQYLSWSSQRDVPAPINVTRSVVPILSLDTGQVVRELHPSVMYSSSQWLFIARGVDPQGRSGIVKIDGTTGETSLVVPNETCSGIPALASDTGSFFCFGEQQIVQVDVASRTVMRTFPAPGQALSATFVANCWRDSSLTQTAQCQFA